MTSALTKLIISFHKNVLIWFQLSVSIFHLSCSKGAVQLFFFFSFPKEGKRKFCKYSSLKKKKQTNKFYWCGPMTSIWPKLAGQCLKLPRFAAHHMHFSSCRIKGTWLMLANLKSNFSLTFFHETCSSTQWVHWSISHGHLKHLCILPKVNNFLSQFN